MNENKSIKDKINEFFALSPKFNDLEVKNKVEESDKKKFEAVTLLDGNVVNIEPAIEAGAMITIEVEGVIVPAPIGEHPLEDGRIIVITEEGIISEVKESTEEEEVKEPVEEELATESVVTPQAKKVIESIVKEHVFEAVKGLEKRNEHLQKENDFLKESFAELKENTGEALKELFAVPAKEPIKKKKRVFQKEETNIFIKSKNK